MDSIIVGSIFLARLNRTMACFFSVESDKMETKKASGSGAAFRTVLVSCCIESAVR